MTQPRVTDLEARADREMQRLVETIRDHQAGRPFGFSEERATAALLAARELNRIFGEPSPDSPSGAATGAPDFGQQIERLAARVAEFRRGAFTVPELEQ